MKKSNGTLPSTRPDHLYSSQPSQASMYRRAPSYQQQLSSLFSSLRATHHLRSSLLFRDIQPIFSNNQPLLSELLGVTSAQHLWELLAANGQEQLREQEQIGLLLRLLLALNSRKHTEADKGNIISFDQYRAIIEWLIPQIVAYEASLRLQLEQQLLQACENEKHRRLVDFRRYESRMKEEFEALEEVRKEGLGDRFQREAEAKQVEIGGKIQQDMHKIRASTHLRDAKETALLRKLAPYRWEKKRPYQDHTYRIDLQQTLDLDKSRKTRVIEQMKKVEKEKLRRAQETYVSTQEMYAEAQRERLHLHLASEGAALRGHEQQALRNLRHSVDVTNYQRISSLRKSLQAFNKHQDTLKIRQILHDHHNKVQFCNIIEEAIQPQARVHALETPYRTIQTDRIGSKLQEAADWHQRRLKKRLNEILGDTQETENSGRKSLVDLYDKSMNLVHP